MSVLKCAFLIKLLLEYKANADIVNDQGQTPLHLALFNMVSLFGDSHINPNELKTIAELLIPNMSKTPLSKFMKTDFYKHDISNEGVFLIRLCVKRGATADALSIGFLLRSSWPDDNKIIALELMLAHKAPNTKPERQLRRALSFNLPFRGIKMLLDDGADINREDESEDTPLTIAVKRSNYEVVQLLLSYEELDIDLHRRKLAPLIEVMDSNIKNLLVDANLISPIHTT